MVENFRRPGDTVKTFDFLKQIEPFSEAEKSKIVKALAIAHVAHGETRRLNKKDLFVDHPITVASFLLKQNIWDADVICGALLHDVAEDTDYFHKGFLGTIGYREYVEKIKQKLAAQGFSEKTAEIVISLTKPAISDESRDDVVIDGIDFFNHDQAYDKKLDLLEHASPEALLVKMADRLHNLMTFYPGDPAKGKDKPWNKIDETWKMAEIFITVAGKKYPGITMSLFSKMISAVVKLKQDYPR
jgi:(p)ppGpp synthase/HD superfamily hydrolase